MIAAFAVAVGGGLGAALRFVVDRFVTSHRRGSLPLGTVLVNVVGSFGLGVVSGLGILLGPEWTLSLIHISEPTRQSDESRMPSSA